MDYSIKDAWEEWSNSDNPELKNLADILAPSLSLKKEIESIRFHKDPQKEVLIEKILDKYADHKTGKISTYDNNLAALREIRKYLVNF